MTESAHISSTQLAWNSSKPAARKKRVEVKVQLVKFYREHPQASTLDAMRQFGISRRTAQKYKRWLSQQPLRRAFDTLDIRPHEANNDR